MRVTGFYTSLRRQPRARTVFIYPVSPLSGMREGTTAMRRWPLRSPARAPRRAGSIGKPRRGHGTTLHREERRSVVCFVGMVGANPPYDGVLR